MEEGGRRETFMGERSEVDAVARSDERRQLEGGMQRRGFSETDVRDGRCDDNAQSPIGCQLNPRSKDGCCREVGAWRGSLRDGPGQGKAEQYSCSLRDGSGGRMRLWWRAGDFFFVGPLALVELTGNNGQVDWKTPEENEAGRQTGVASARCRFVPGLPAY